MKRPSLGGEGGTLQGMVLGLKKSGGSCGETGRVHATHREPSGALAMTQGRLCAKGTQRTSAGD